MNSVPRDNVDVIMDGFVDMMYTQICTIGESKRAFRMHATYSMKVLTWNCKDAAETVAHSYYRELFTS